jgi:hypothetical protein
MKRTFSKSLFSVPFVYLKVPIRFDVYEPDGEFKLE